MKCSANGHRSKTVLRASPRRLQRLGVSRPSRPCAVLRCGEALKRFIYIYKKMLVFFTSLILVPVLSLRRAYVVLTSPPPFQKAVGNWSLRPHSLERLEVPASFIVPVSVYFKPETDR